VTVAEILEEIKESYRSVLNNKLVGIYVHGSVAFGCFTWNCSDIDFIAVVTDPLTQEEKEALITILLHLDPHCPVKGFEMSVVTADVCSPFFYPTPYELHFSNAYKERYRADLSDLCRELHGTDKDLAAHFTVIRHAGTVLYGEEIAAIFGEVPAADYLDSILGDIGDADDSLPENPVYFILNHCRVLAYLEEGTVISKKEGGEWGLTHLPAMYHPIIGAALRDYRGEAAIAADSGVTHTAVCAFIGYMKKRIHEKI